MRYLNRRQRVQWRWWIFNAIAMHWMDHRPFNSIDHIQKPCTSVICTVTLRLWVCVRVNSEHFVSSLFCLCSRRIALAVDAVWMHIIFCCRCISIAFAFNLLLLKTIRNETEKERDEGNNITIGLTTIFKTFVRVIIHVNDYSMRDRWCLYVAIAMPMLLLWSVKWEIQNGSSTSI